MGIARGIASIAKTSLQRGQAPLETYQHRLAVCGQCDKRYVDELNRNRCEKCNC